mmetsp:Transcript_33862/g.81446  ORF Transcript_33862/g.81446 Transcript_33862/m.81446 type:complete len:296 (-) Transcript_33862:154-1041(-)
MASLHGLNRGMLRIGGAATATAFVATLVGDKTAARISTQAASTATTAAGRFGREQFQKYYSPSRGFSVASDNATKSAVESASSKKGFVQWYESHLESRPVATKMATGCLLWSIGDGVAQIVPQVASSDSDNSKPLTYDWERTGRAALFGFAVHAPTSHVHFNFLEWMTVKGGFTGLYIPVFKTIMEQFVYWSWISNSMYHAFMGYMQGMNTIEVVQRIDDVLMDTQKAQWAFWIPVQLLNFQFIPVRHQLNVVLVTSIVWTALLSAWYPPVEDKDMKKIDAEVIRQVTNKAPPSE